MTTTINADNGVSSGSAGLKQTADNSGVLALQTNGTTALTLDASQNATFAGSITSAGATGSLNSINTFGFKNRVINGAMVIDQRNAGASVTPTSGQFLVDRWAYYGSQTSKFTAQQNQGSVTPPTGFTNYQGLTSSSAYTSLTGDFFMLQYGIEGYNVADLAWGTANAKTVTLSFWVRSSLTGQFGGCIGNSNFSRSYPFSYTISSANTWTQISITIPGDTSGTYNTTNGAGIFFTFDLGCGANYLGTAGSWSAGSYRGATGDTKVVGTNGATFYITGVQLEVGSQATSFDFRSIGTELALCQRYYVKTYAQSTVVPTNSASGFVRTRSYSGAYAAFVWCLPVNMRAAPTATIYNSSTSATNSWYNPDASTSAAASVSTTGEQNITVESSAVATNNTYTFHLVGSAEL